MTFGTAVLRISAGVLVWGLHFTAMYGFTALACARGWTAAVVPGVLLTTGIAVLLTAAVIMAGLRRRREFESWLGAWIGGFALIAILYEAAPLFIIPACG